MGKAIEKSQIKKDPYNNFVPAIIGLSLCFLLLASFNENLSWCWILGCVVGLFLHVTFRKY